jgi:hypothetical protein
MNSNDIYYQLCSYFVSFGGWGRDGLNLSRTTYARQLAGDVIAKKITMEQAKNYMRIS